MEIPRNVCCTDNEGLASFLWKKRQEIAEGKGNSSNRIDSTLCKAYCNVCDCKSHIKTLKDFSEIKGVGKWTIRLVQEFFVDAEDSGTKNEKQNRRKESKRYVPQKNSVAYALLITLYRATKNGNNFMKKQELIQEADASGLSRAAIGPEKGKGKAGQFGNSFVEGYSGWSCMKTLIKKGLILKSSRPSKYMLTDEGKEAACECMSRSGLLDSNDDLSESEKIISDINGTGPTLDLSQAIDSNEAALTPKYKKCQKKLHNADRAQVEKDEFENSFSNLGYDLGKESFACAPSYSLRNTGQVDFVVKESRVRQFTSDVVQHSHLCLSHSSSTSLQLRSCEHSKHPSRLLNMGKMEDDMSILAMPPNKYGEMFEDAYDVILVLDDREQFSSSNRGSSTKKVVDTIQAQFHILVEMRRLPVGDGIWIARSKHHNDEYVLDFIVERKNVDDLCSSIKDNRYKDQKLRLLRCGLRKLIYLVEGDPNSCEAAESIKTACFTTEILEGFDVHRTEGVTDTMRKYGHLTLSIKHYYNTYFNKTKPENGVCPSFGKFVERCQDLEKMTVTDVFAVQLMQVPQVTEEVAVSVLDRYPSLISLVNAYANLEGDVRAQEQMLKNQCDNISSIASKNIFKLVWGS